MSNIAGLLSNLLSTPLPDTSARGPSSQRNNTAPGKGGANGFDTILSKIGQNGAPGATEPSAQLPGSPGGAAKPGPAVAGANANALIENAIASIDAQTPADAAARAAASNLMSEAALTAASTNAKGAAQLSGASGAATRTAKTSSDTTDAGSTTGLPGAKTGLPGTAPLPGMQLRRSADGGANTPSAGSGARTTAATTSQLSASLSAASGSEAAASASAADEGQVPAPKSGAADTSNAAVNNNAATAVAVVVDMIAAGQPGVPPAAADHKTNTQGKTTRSPSADGSARTSSKQNSSTDKTDAPTANAILDPSLQSVVMASAGLNSNAGQQQPSQPSFQAQPQEGVGATDPNLKAIMTASAIAEANSAAKMHTGGEPVDDADGPTILRVLSTETHFAPVAELSPVQQIAGSVIGALPNPAHPFGASATDTDAGETGAAAATGTASASATDSGTSAITGPVKILNLQLEPPNLGTVTINLSLSDGGLNVQLAASQVSTMNLIDKDKDALSNQLRDSGYAIAGVGVTISIDGSNVPNSGSATQDQLGQSAAQGGQTMSNGGSSNGNASSQSGGNGSPQQPLPQTAGDFPKPSAARGPAAGDLYI